MRTKSVEYHIDLPADVTRYIRSGQHAFIGCDDSGKREEFVKTLRRALANHPVEQIDGDQVSNTRDFAVLVVEACQGLTAEIGEPSLRRTLGIASSLEEVTQAYAATGYQGFLILNDIDPVIRTQRTIELEGPLRSVMQCYDDVAVILCGSNQVVNRIVGEYDRPFTCRFACFDFDCFPAFGD